MHSKILILALLRDSESHRNALMKLLRTSFVPQEISVNQFEGIVNSISASNELRFTNFDLHHEGRKYNKVFQISIEMCSTLLCFLPSGGKSKSVKPSCDTVARTETCFPIF